MKHIYLKTSLTRVALEYAYKSFIGFRVDYAPLPEGVSYNHKVVYEKDDARYEFYDVMYYYEPPSKETKSTFSEYFFDIPILSTEFKRRSVLLSEIKKGGT